MVKVVLKSNLNVFGECILGPKYGNLNILSEMFVDKYLTDLIYVLHFKSESIIFLECILLKKVSVWVLFVFLFERYLLWHLK